MESHVFQSSVYSRSLFLGSFKPTPQLQSNLYSGDLKFEANSARSRRRLLKCMSRSDIYDSVQLKPNQQQQEEELVKEIVNPVYLPTPSNRPLRTPHSGYHFDGTRRNFFEGWYFKVSIPEQRQSFCFMYSIENPAFNKPLNTLEQLQYGPRSTGVGAQILGADDKYICQYTKESPNFWGSRHELMLGNSFTVQKGQRPPNSEVPPQVFNRSVVEGFQVTPLWHQGCIRDDGRCISFPFISPATSVKTEKPPIV